MEHRTLVGGPGADRIINGGSTEGVLVGGSGPDTLTSKGHNDWLIGGPGTDVLTLSGSGDTVLALTADGDLIRNRRAGYIVLLYQGSPGPIEVDLAAETVRRVGAATDLDLQEGLIHDVRQTYPGRGGLITKTTN